MIIGHERQIEYINRVLQKNRLAHAYFLYGPEHIGKLAVAQALAQALACKNYRSPTSIIFTQGACGACTDCRTIERGAHPQVILLNLTHTLTSEKNERSAIPIRDIQELKRLFSLMPAGDTWRIAIIDGVDTMSGDAADAFLKLLEEPGARTLFFLIAPTRESVAPTIVSRAVPIRFSLVPDAMLTAFAEKHMPRENIQEIVRLTAGRPGILVEFSRDAARIKEAKQALASFTAALEGGIPSALLFTEKAATGDWSAAVAMLARELRERMHASASPQERTDSAHRIARMIDLYESLEDTNVNPRLLLDAMFIQVI